MRITAKSFNALISPTDKSVLHMTKDDEKVILDLVQVGLIEEGIDSEVSLSIASILLGLKKNQQTLTDDEINTIVDSCTSYLVKFEELTDWLTDKKHLIAFINTLKELKSASFKPQVHALAGDIVEHSSAAAQAENQLVPAVSASVALSHADLLALFHKLVMLLEIDSNGKNDAALKLLLDDINKLSELQRVFILKQTDHRGVNILMFVICHYHFDLLPSVIELINQLPTEDQIAILAQVIPGNRNSLMMTAQLNPALIVPLIKLIDDLKNPELKVNLFKALSYSMGYWRCNPLMYLVSGRYHPYMSFTESYPPEPVLLFLESMKTFSKEDKSVIFEQKSYNGTDALHYLVTHRRFLSFHTILAKMIEVLPSYAVTIADRLTVSNFAINDEVLQLNKPGAASAFVNLLTQLYKIPAYKKSDWEILIKQEKGPITEFALLTLLLKHSVMGMDEYLSILLKHQGVAAFVALWQENERALNSEDIKDPIRHELLMRLSENKPYAQDALIAYLEISQPITASDCRLARMQGYQEKFKNIVNRAQVLYAFYLENEHTSGVFQRVELLLNVFTVEKNPHPEDLMVLALILTKEAEKYGVQKDSLDDGEQKASALLQESMLRRVKICLQRINDGAHPLKQRFHTAKPDPICQALIYGTPLTETEDPRGVSSFLLAFEADIRKIFPVRSVINAPELKVPAAQNDKSDRDYEEGGRYEL